MKIDRQAARREATKVVAEYLHLPEHVLNGNAVLLDLAGFDSIAVVAVLARLEDRFGIEVAAELIVPEAFESVDTLADLLVSATSGDPARSRR